VQFTNFGSTGLTVSRLVLGTGTFGKQTDEQEAHRMLEKAAEAGINFIDTADIYPPGAEVGSSEVLVGRWLGKRRGEFILATKGGGRMGPAVWAAGNSRKHLLDAIDDSCAASTLITLIFTNSTWMTPLPQSTKSSRQWIRSCDRVGRGISAFQTLPPIVWPERSDGRTH
jgi:aryl-alcohol dehydrogenase-like predicted oxidoreductase